MILIFPFSFKFLAKRGPFGKAKVSSKAPPTPAGPTEPTEPPNQRRIEKEILDTILGNRRLDNT